MKTINLFTFALVASLTALTAHADPSALRQTPEQRAEKTIVGAKRFMSLVPEVDVMAWHPYAAYPQECPLTNHNHILLNGEVQAMVQEETPVKDVKDQRYYRLFYRYSNCLPGYNPLLLQALAYVESGLRADVVSHVGGFTGLFQTNENYCRSVLKKYELEGRCTDLRDPQTSTMVATAILIQAAEMIRNAETCQKFMSSRPDDRHRWLYLGHHSGLLALRSVLATTCNPANTERALAAFWHIQRLDYQTPTPTP